VLKTASGKWSGAIAVQAGKHSTTKAAHSMANFLPKRSRNLIPDLIGAAWLPSTSFIIASFQEYDH
jgi:hypothetical protein